MYTTRLLALMLAVALLSGCGDVNEDLVEAAVIGDVDAITTALSAGADATAALTTAVERGLAEAVATLPDHGADPAATASDGTPLIVLAAKLGDTGSVNALTSRLETSELNDVDSGGRTALMWAAESGHAETVNALLEAGADVSAEAANGDTALTLAAQAGEAGVGRLRNCREGQELGPGQSCYVEGGAFSVREDGCLGDLPTLGGEGLVAIGSRRIDEGLLVGRMSFRVSSPIPLEAFGGPVEGCIREYIEIGGFRASETSESSAWRIDALP